MKIKVILEEKKKLRDYRKKQNMKFFIMSAANFLKIFSGQEQG